MIQKRIFLAGDYRVIIIKVSTRLYIYLEKIEKMIPPSIAQLAPSIYMQMVAATFRSRRGASNIYIFFFFSHLIILFLFWFFSLCCDDDLRPGGGKQDEIHMRLNITRNDVTNRKFFKMGRLYSLGCEYSTTIKLSKFKVKGGGGFFSKNPNVKRIEPAGWWMNAFSFLNKLKK